MGEKVYTHEVFREILHNANYPIPSVSANYIRRNRDECGISTIRQSKTCLSLIDNKRFWVSLNHSYAFGHPETYKLGYKDDDIVAASGSRIKALDQYDNEDFYDEFCSSESQYDNGDFFSETVQSDDLFFFGENGEEALVENGDTYSTAVDDEHDLDLIYE